jgi:hypothetical protein
MGIFDSNRDSPEVLRDVRKAAVSEVNDAVMRKVALIEDPVDKLAMVGSVAKALVVSVYVTVFVNADPEVQKDIKPEEFVDSFRDDLIGLMTDVDRKLRRGELNDLISESNDEELVEDIHQATMKDVLSLVARRVELFDSPVDQMGLVIKTALALVLTYYKTGFFNTNEAERVEFHLNPVDVAKNFHDDLLINLNTLDERLRKGLELKE